MLFNKKLIINFFYSFCTHLYSVMEFSNDNFDVNVTLTIVGFFQIKNFDAHIFQLAEFMRYYPDGPCYDGYRTKYEFFLCAFVAWQRHRYVSDALDAETIAKFEKNIPGWSWDSESDVEMRKTMSVFSREPSQS